MPGVIMRMGNLVMEIRGKQDAGSIEYLSASTHTFYFKILPYEIGIGPFQL